jgi:hypothetical protein
MTLAELIIHGSGLIHVITKAMADASEQKITPDEALEQMQRIGANLMAVNARVDAAADAKFGPKTAEEDGE